MFEVGSSNSTNQNSTKQEMESEISMSSTPNNQTSNDVNMLLSKDIEESSSELKAFAANLAEKERKFEILGREIKQDRLKMAEMKRKLENKKKAQYLWNNPSAEETIKNTAQENGENLPKRQESVNKEKQVNLPSTSRNCNKNCNSIQAEPSGCLAAYVERARQIRDIMNNINDEVLSQDSSDDASVNTESYRPSVHTESTETQSLEQVNISKISLPWDIACRDLLDVLHNHKDSYYFREPVDEKRYTDYRKYVIAPMCLRDIREQMLSGEYKSPLEFSKDVKLIFENSRKYNTDKSAPIYKQTTRLKKLFDENIQQVISDFKAFKKSRNSGSPSKRKTSGSDNESSDEDNDSQSRLKRRRKRIKNILSDDEETASKKVSIDDEKGSDGDESNNDDDQPMRTRSRTARNKSRVMQDEDAEEDEDYVWSDEYDESFIDDEDQSAYEDESAYEDDSIHSDEEIENQRNENENIESFTSDNCIKNYRSEEWVKVKGKVLKVFKTVRQRCNKKNMNYKLFKFLLQTKEGNQIECVAWEDVAVSCQSEIRRNQVLTLDKVRVKPCIDKPFNKGNFEIQLVLYNHTTIEHH